MDPNACLTEMLELADRIRTSDRDRYMGSGRWIGDRLAELFLALDQWIRKGGAIPDQWLAARIRSMPTALPEREEEMCEFETHTTTSYKVTRCLLAKGHDGPHCVEVEWPMNATTFLFVLFALVALWWKHRNPNNV